MRALSSLLLVLLVTNLQACNAAEKKRQDATTIGETVEKQPEAQSKRDLSEYNKAYFASGCFWCVEAIFESVKGVEEVISGYSGGKEKDPTYKQVSYGNTTHAEAVEVYYDPKAVSFSTLVQVFFGSHDPTQYHRQGPDRGPQYRSIAFYQNEDEKRTIQNYIRQLTEANVYRSDIVTEVKAFERFYKAEDYHQDYEKRNPDQPYVKAVSIPRLKRFQKLYPELLKDQVH